MILFSYFTKNFKHSEPVFDTESFCVNATSTALYASQYDMLAQYNPRQKRVRVRTGAATLLRTVKHKNVRSHSNEISYSMFAHKQLLIFALLKYLYESHKHCVKFRHFFFYIHKQIN